MSLLTDVTHSWSHLPTQTPLWWNNSSAVRLSRFRRPLIYSYLFRSDWQEAEWDITPPVQCGEAPTHMCVLVCLHVCVLVCLHVCVLACLHVCVLVCRHVCVGVSICVWAVCDASRIHKHQIAVTCCSFTVAETFFQTHLCPTACVQTRDAAAIS